MKNRELDHKMSCEELRRAARNFSLTCGILGLIGCVGVVIGQIAGVILVEKHNPISETISKLAIGKYAWVQDVGLDLYAVAVIAIGVGLYAWNLGGLKWKIGSLLLVVLGVDVILIAEHNQYADRPGYGTAIHIYLVYAFGLLFALSAFLTAFGLRKIHQHWYYFNLGTTIAWLIFAPIFFFVPTGWDGLYERLLGVFILVWTVAFSRLLIRRGLGKRKSSD